MTRRASPQSDRLGAVSASVVSRMDRLPDQSLRRLLEMGPQIGVHVGELPPHHRIEQPPRRLDHDRRAALTRVAEGLNAIAPTQGDEQSRRPFGPDG